MKAHEESYGKRKIDILNKGVELYKVFKLIKSPIQPIKFG